MCHLRCSLSLSTNDAIARMRKNADTPNISTREMGTEASTGCKNIFDIWIVFLFWFHYVHFALDMRDYDAAERQKERKNNAKYDRNEITTFDLITTFM